MLWGILNAAPEVEVSQKLVIITIRFPLQQYYKCVLLL